MIRRPFTIALFLLALVASVPRAGAQDQSLFAQSASAALKHQFGSGNLSWILLDRSGQVLAQDWPHVDRPIPPGSLLKPFVALAWGEQHNFAFPRVLCRGTRDRCWLPRGHGTLDLEEALTNSCNAYFLALAQQLDPSRAASTFMHLGLAGPPLGATPAAFIGLSDVWRMPPLTLARAYLSLLDDSDPIRNRIVLGMQRAAQIGTASALDETLGSRAVLAKTGTAICTHHPRATADGFSIVIYPAAQPRVLLLLRMHGATGAQTSAEAAVMLRSLGMGRQ